MVPLVLIEPPPRYLPSVLHLYSPLSYLYNKSPPWLLPLSRPSLDPLLPATIPMTPTVSPLPEVRRRSHDTMFQTLLTFIH